MTNRKQIALDDRTTPESDAAVLTYRLGGKLSMEVEDLIATWGVTLRQFNVLRILYVRDPERKGLSRGFLEAGMMQRGPDVSRLLDRLEASGMIERRRSPEDKRSVLSALTDKGWNLIEDSHLPLISLNREQFKEFSAQDLKHLIRLLEKAFSRPSIDLKPKKGN